MTEYDCFIVCTSLDWGKKSSWLFFGWSIDLFLTSFVNSSLSMICIHVKLATSETSNETYWSFCMRSCPGIMQVGQVLVSTCSLWTPRTSLCNKQLVRDWITKLSEYLGGWWCCRINDCFYCDIEGQIMMPVVWCPEKLPFRRPCVCLVRVSPIMGCWHIGVIQTCLFKW